MKRPGFFEGVAVGLVGSLVGSVLSVAFALVFSTTTSLNLLIALLGLAYTVYLLSRSGERVGRLTTLILWFLAAGFVWFWSPGLPVYLLFHVVLVWLIRSLYFHASLLSALADLGLHLLAPSVCEAVAAEEEAIAAEQEREA